MEKYYFRLSRQSIGLIGAGVILNIICFSIATYYSIPFFLDAVGVFGVSVLMGPIAGIIVAILSNLIYGSIVYSIPAIGAAIIAGWLMYKKDRIDAFRIIGTGFLAGVASAILALPGNMIFGGGVTGNLWGDALSEMLAQHIGAKWVCCLAGGLIVNVPDKIFTLIAIMAVVKLLRREGVTLTLTVLLAASVLINAQPVLPAYAAAEDEMDFTSEYAQNFYGGEDGLNSAEINTITQTGDGYIWAGGYSGLYRYNGTRFEQVNIDERITNALALYTDRKGRLWIGTNDSGVACYDPYSGNIDFITADDGLCSNSIRDITEDRKGNIYLATASHICRIAVEGQTTGVKDLEGKVIRDKYDGTGESKVSMFFGDVRLKVYYYMSGITFAETMEPAGDSGICGVTENGTFFVIRDDRLIASSKSDEEGILYYCATAIGDSSFAVGTNDGRVELLRLENDEIIKERVLGTANLSLPNKIYYYGEFDGLFIGGETGFGFLQLSGRYQDLQSESFHSAISDMTIDKQGNIWFTSTKQGITKFSYNPFEDMFRKGGIAEHAVNAVMIDGRSVYVATDTGVLKLDRDTGKQISDERLSFLSGKRIRHIMKDSAGNIWISTYSSVGVVRLDSDGGITTFNPENSIVLGSKFRFTMQLRDGSVLAASTEGLSFITGDSVVRVIGAGDGLSVAKILSACEDESGTLWVGTDGGGVYEIRDGRPRKHYGLEEGLQSGVVMKIVPCEGGRLYVASNGLYFHSKATEDPEAAPIRKLTHFPYNNNYDIYITDDGRAFISSSAGLFAVSASELVADDHDYSYALLNRKRGLTATLTSNAWNGISNGRIYLCCTNGVMVLNMKDYEDFDPRYQIVLKSLTKGGKEITAQNGIYNIPAGAGAVRFTPVILNYTVSDPLVHVVLDGVDDEGITMRQSELGEIYYPSLPFGNYSLHVQVLSDNGEVVKKEKVFLIHKEAKLYEHTYYKVYLAINLSLLLLFLAWLVAKMGNMAVINRQYDQIKEAKEDAELANQAKSKFLAQMSHEIRTPINAVLGMDEMILRESREPEIRAYAADIYTAGQTLLSLINDILDSSKIDSGKMEIVPANYELQTLIRDLVNMISQRAQAKDLMLEVEVDPDLPKGLFGDDVRIRQVITNILTNAVKYTESGTVWLRVGGTRMGDRLNLHVEVEDTGIGIKEEDLPKLFEAYQRIEEQKNRKIEGTGLGLNITVSLLRLMGSELKADSIYGKGSKFYFDLQQGIVDSAAIGRFEDFSGRSNDLLLRSDMFIAPDAKILVVDDNAMNRKVFRSLTKRSQVQVSEASGGMEALAKVEHQHYDIIFMDHMMPEMDGVETMKRMREMECCDGIPIYVLTANAVTGAREEYLALGFDGYLAKPVAADKLEEALRESLPEALKKPVSDEELQADLSVAAASSGPPQLPDVDGLDWNYAWLHLPGADMLKEGVESFYDTILPQAEKLEEFYEAVTAAEGDAKGEALAAYRIQVHGMKSGAATVGIVPLAGMAKVLEYAAAGGKEDTILGMHAAFISEWRSYTEKLKGVYGLGQSADAEKGDPELLTAMLDMLIPAMEDLDIDTADEIMAKMKKYTFGGEADALIAKMAGAVKNLDEDEVKAIADELGDFLKGN